MKHLVARWRVKGKLKLLLILLVTFSILFISYQLLSYSSLTQYQFEENQAILQLNLHRHSEELSAPLKSKSSQSDYRLNRISEVRGKPSFAPVLGVAPRFWELYHQGAGGSKFFKCFGTGKKIAWAKVNDDFCDCSIDGSDEPSTNACNNGRFICTKTQGKFAVDIPSSRVNDGICDCCDGSDEYENMFFEVKCKKHC